MNYLQSDFVHFVTNLNGLEGLAPHQKRFKPLISLYFMQMTQKGNFQNMNNFRL